MAETITRQLREPFVEAAGTRITDEGLKLLNQAIPTATYTGRRFVQDQSALERQATQAAAGLDSLVGPDAYKQFMSPYQQEVIDTSLAAMDREQQKGIGALRQRAAMSGAFGERQLEQAKLAADQEQAREAAFADYTRLGLVGPQLASVIGGFPAATQVQSTPPPSATQQLLGLGIGGAGLAGALGFKPFGR